MTESAAERESVGFDDLWRRDHWRDALGGDRLDGFAAAVLIFAVAWNLIGNLWLPSAAWVPANLALAALLVLGARRVGISFGELGLRRDRMWRGFAVGAIAGTVVLVALAIAFAVPETRAAFDRPDVARHVASTDLYVAAIRIPLGTVVFEEVLFRGVMLALAFRRWSVRTSVLVIAGLFGLWHVVPAVETADGNVLAVLGAILGTVAITTVAGLAFAWLRLRANSLVAPVLAHVATNSLAYVAAAAVAALR